MPDRALTCSRIVPSTMPSKPAWFPRLPEILDVIVYSMDASYLDRQAVEHLGTVTLPEVTLHRCEINSGQHEQSAT